MSDLLFIALLLWGSFTLVFAGMAWAEWCELRMFEHDDDSAREERTKAARAILTAPAWPYRAAQACGKAIGKFWTDAIR